MTPGPAPAGMVGPGVGTDTVTSAGTPVAGTSADVVDGAGSAGAGMVLPGAVRAGPTVVVVAPFSAGVSAGGSIGLLAGAVKE